MGLLPPDVHAGRGGCHVEALADAEPCTSRANSPNHSFPGRLCTDMKVPLDRDAVVLPSPQRCACVCPRVCAFSVEICCIASRSPQQIYSSASTHPGPYTGHAIPSGPGVRGRLCSPLRRRAGDKWRGWRGVGGGWPPGSGALPRIFAGGLWSEAAPGVVTKNPLRSGAAGSTSSGIP